MTVKIFENAASMDFFAAGLVTEQAREAVADRGICHLVLSGGGTPAPLFNLLSQPEHSHRFPWQQTHVYWADERLVPPDDPESNYYQANRLLLSRVPIPSESIHRIKGELSPVQAAADYRKQLLKQAPVGFHWPLFDIVLLGMGADGHTASLFPGPLTQASQQYAVIPVQAQYAGRPANRLTLTPTALNDGRNVIFLVKGDEKANALSAVLHGPVNEERWPAQRIKPVDGLVTWLLDKDAAKDL